MNVRVDQKTGKHIELRIRAPFEGHAHFRDNSIMRAVAGETARHFPAGAVAMPNLVPPITTWPMADAYRQRILGAIGDPQYPLVMTGYLTEETDPVEIYEGSLAGVWKAMKFYPRGMTTNSHGGVSDIKKLAPVFEAMEKFGIPALFHGESEFWANEEKTDIYDRETAFYMDAAPWLVETFPNLKISCEHGSSRAFAEFMIEFGEVNHVVGTVTVHHLLFNRNDFFAQGPDVHLHCYPVLKRVEDQLALRSLATAGHRFIFAGTDSAPHPTHAKERACGCAGGVVTAHAAVELYAEVFEEENKLERLENFLSVNGPGFYDLTPTAKTIVLRKESWTVDKMITTEDGMKIRPLFYHEDRELRRPIRWKLIDE